MRDGYKVIDMRARPPTGEFLRYFHPDHVRFFGKRLGMPDLPPSYERRDLGLFFEEADRAGVDRMVIVNRIVPAAGGSPLGDVPNEHVADLVRQYPDRFVGVAGIDVGGDFGDPVAEIERCVRELGMKAIHISPTRSRLATHADDRRLYDCYELCMELGIAVVVMSGPFSGASIEDTHPKYIQGLARDFPKLPIVAGHACWPYFPELLGVAYRHENVFVSPDAYLFMPGGEQLVAAANGFLQDQFLYGSAYPVRELDRCLDLYMRLPLSEASFRKSLYDNAARLLKID